MRICFYSSGNSLQGGAERIQARIVQYLVSSGDDVHVVLPKSSELTEHYQRIGANVHIIFWQHLQRLTDPIHVFRYLFGLPIITFRLIRLLRRERIEIMHVNELLDFQGLVAARLARVPCVTFVRIILPNRFMRWIVRRIGFALAHRVVTVSHATHRMALGGSRSKKHKVIYDPGADLTVFDPDSVAPIQQSRHEGCRVIGMIAKLVREKGHLLLVEIAGRLQKQGYTNLRYQIVGGEVPGHEQYAKELRQAVTRAGLDECVEFLGQQNNVAGYLAGWDIVCHLPLVEDCFPGVILESAAMARPIVSFVSGGIPEQVTHPTSARLVKIGDIDGLQREVIDLLDHPDVASQMGKNARQEVTSRFSIEKHRAEHKKLYDELLHRRNPSA